MSAAFKYVRPEIVEDQFSSHIQDTIDILDDGISEIMYHHQSIPGYNTHSTVTEQSNEFTTY